MVFLEAILPLDLCRLASKHAYVQIKGQSRGIMSSRTLTDSCPWLLLLSNLITKFSIYKYICTSLPCDMI